MLAKAEFKFLGKQVSIQGFSQSDWILSSIINNNEFYEIDLLRYMRFTLRKSDGYILDVGANIGNHAVFFGMFMGKEIVCFEPNPAVFEILKRNLVINKVEHEAYNIGLGENDGRFSIDDTHDAAINNIGAAKLQQADDGQIVVKRLDHMVDELDDRFKNKKLLAVKVDIEGMEPEMLKGGISTLQRYKPDLFIEITNDQLMKEIKEILFPLGYEALYSHAGTPVWHFSHQSKLPPERRLELAIYTTLEKIIHFAGRICAKAIRRLIRS